MRRNFNFLRKEYLSSLRQDILWAIIAIIVNSFVFIFIYISLIASLTTTAKIGVSFLFFIVLGITIYMCMWLKIAIKELNDNK